MDWRSFSLDQVNERAGPGRNVWDRPEGYEAERLRGFLGAEAARRQGPAAFERFHLALLRLRHEEGRKLSDPATVLDAARAAELDLARFVADLEDPRGYAALAAQHTEAVERHAVFGTPTLVFPSGAAAYLKMRPAPPPDEALAVFEELRQLIEGRPNIAEVKRPVRR